MIVLQEVKHVELHTNQDVDEDEMTNKHNVDILKNAKKWVHENKENVLNLGVLDRGDEIDVIPIKESMLKENINVNNNIEDTSGY